MINELELAATDAVGSLVADGATIQPSHTHSQCLNCGAHLQGQYCHVCGQSADDHHRSIVHLAWEAVEGFTHLDGRLGKTLPALLLSPGKLARDHIEGRRTRHVPPFRLFLIALLLFMLAMEAVVHHQSSLTHIARTPHVSAAGQPVASTPPPGHGVADVQLGQLNTRPHVKSLNAWLQTHIKRAVANPELYVVIVFEWAHRLAVLMLPIMAGLLTLLYIRKRQFYIYDHLIVSMQYLAFCFLVGAVLCILPGGVAGWLLRPAMALLALNLFMTLRGAYASSWIGSGVKALFLLITTLTMFSFLMVGLLALALSQV